MRKGACSAGPVDHFAEPEGARGAGGKTTGGSAARTQAIGGGKRHQQKRQSLKLEQEFGNVRADHLPPILQLGLPPALVRQQAGTFWGATKTSMGAIDHAVSEACGLANDKFGQAVAEGYDLNDDEFLKDKIGQR